MNLTPTKDEWLAVRRKRLAGRTELTQPRKPLGVAAAGALLAVLVPKCPLCLATYLSFLGAAASWVVWLRPIGIALTVAGVALATWRIGAGRRGIPQRRREDARAKLLGAGPPSEDHSRPGLTRSVRRPSTCPSRAPT